MATGSLDVTGGYGVDDLTYCPGTAGVTWSGNVWDDNGQAVSCST